MTDNSLLLVTAVFSPTSRQTRKHRITLFEKREHDTKQTHGQIQFGRTRQEQRCSRTNIARGGPDSNTVEMVLRRIHVLSSGFLFWEKSQDSFSSFPATQPRFVISWVVFFILSYFRYYCFTTDKHFIYSTFFIASLYVLDGDEVASATWTDIRREKIGGGSFDFWIRTWPDIQEESSQVKRRIPIQCSIANCIQDDKKHSNTMPTRSSEENHLTLNPPNLPPPLTNHPATNTAPTLTTPKAPNTLLPTTDSSLTLPILVSFLPSKTSLPSPSIS